MIIELTSQEDLWRLFGGDNHLEPGKWQQPFATVEQYLLDKEGYHKHQPDTPGPDELARAKKKIKQRFSLTDQSRFYLLIASDRQACVDQSRLLPMGKAMRERGMMVAYLGEQIVK